MMGCEKTRIRLDDWLDGLLDENARGEVNDHLAFCESCRALFKQHLDLQSDLAELGSVADRIAANGSGAATGRHWRGLRVIAAAAAMLALVVTGYLLTRESSQELQSGTGQKFAQIDGRELKPLGDLMVRRMGNDRVQIKEGPNCVAVEVETSNPKVRVVWLYGDCVNNAANGSRKVEPESKSTEIRRL